MPGALTSLTAAADTHVPACIPSALTFLSRVDGFLLGHLPFYGVCCLFCVAAQGLCGTGQVEKLEGTPASSSSGWDDLEAGSVVSCGPGRTGCLPVKYQSADLVTRVICYCSSLVSF